MNTLQRFSSIEEALITLFGNSVKIAETGRMAGGDINEAYALKLTDGTRIFMKCNAKEKESFFMAEAKGLAAIEKTGTVRTPHILAVGRDERKGAFLLMEYVSGKQRVSDYWETFAVYLAAMHRADTADFTAGGKFGFSDNNYIGSKKQVNATHDSFITFFRECRLKPQFQQAAGYFDAADKKRISRLMDKLEDILVEPECPSLLHGDLWSGNVITGDDGRAWLIDPAVYVGHAEADIAMTELFGGFPGNFYHAYREAALWQEGYERRRDLYNLYHLLNHLNIFGQSYLASVRRILKEYVS